VGPTLRPLHEINHTELRSVVGAMARIRNRLAVGSAIGGQEESS
jgi:hypothetical protein